MNSYDHQHDEQVYDQDYDIVIAGAGLAGSSAALLLAQQGWRIALVDPRPSFTPSAVRDDGRSTAVMPLGIGLIEQLGLQDLLSTAQRITRLCLIDARSPARGYLRSSFDAHEINSPYFGYNIDNALWLKALYELLQRSANITLLPATRVTQALCQPQNDSILATLQSQEAQPPRNVSARLLIAADGRNSTLRQQQNIATQQQEFDQYAFTFRIQHSCSQGTTSHEFYYPDGPITLIPYQDQVSAVVWSFNAERAQAFEALSPTAMAEQLQRSTRGLLGQVRLLSQPHKVQIMTLFAQQLTAPRFALMAEAAHVLPAFGAQGLNTSLADAAALAALLGQERNADPGQASVLQAYQRQRNQDIRARFFTTNGLNRILCNDDQLSLALRRWGFHSLNQHRLPRQLLMRTGMRPLNLNAQI